MNRIASIDGFTSVRDARTVWTPRSRGASAPIGPSADKPPRISLLTIAPRYRPSLYVLLGAMLAAILFYVHTATAPASRPLTQRDIDASVTRTLSSTVIPSNAARAYDTVQDSVVRIRAASGGAATQKRAAWDVGTGVIILQDGTILTNFHVVAASKQLRVVFPDGSESEAKVLSTKPEHDLAVIRAANTPHKVVPAILHSSADLHAGDEAVAVGFPFGIGPSLSSGVISGVHREYLAPDGKHMLTNLIQFDAAANPGNSGGPLATARGEVVGIVTAIISPGRTAGSVGIGFAVPIESVATAIGLPPF